MNATLALALALSQLVTVTLALPAFFAVTVPLSDTESTAGALDLNVTFLFDAFFGLKPTLTFAACPTFRLVADAVAVSFLTFSNFLAATTVTLTFLAAFFAPDFAVTVTVALPAFFAFSAPFLLTETTLGLALL